MDPIKDICRICLQEAGYHDSQEIDLSKLGRLIRNSLLPKWTLNLFQGHIICNTCIENFQTIRTLYRKMWSTDGLVTRMRKSKQVDLKVVAKLQHLHQDFAVCRLCLEPTKHIAIYLYDNPNNILPLKYIKMMLKYINLYMTSLEQTINPILCYKCWQRIQISFSFRQHLDIVTGKIEYFQNLLRKIHVDKEDLQDILHMWDKLGPYHTERVPVGADVAIPNLKLSSPKHKKLVRSEDMPELRPEHICFKEHNYCKKVLFSTNSDTNSAVNVKTDMPFLKPSVQEDVKDLKTPNFSPRALRSRSRVSNAATPYKPCPPTKTTKKKKRKVPTKIISTQSEVRELINSHSEGITSSPKNKKLVVQISKAGTQKEESQNTTIYSENTATAKHMTRLSAKTKVTDYQGHQDLLQLKKTEIVMKKPIKNLNSRISGNTSVPKIPENDLGNQWQKPPSKHSVNECLFEAPKFDNEMRETFMEEEVQIKREPEPVSDSDDNFIEDSTCNANDSDNVEDEQCPNLDAFIKIEPEDIVDVNEDLEEPPELEFQGPCNYDPKFTISHTFTVTDKHCLNSTSGEKRNLMDSLDENPPSLPLVDTSYKTGAVGTENSKYSLDSSKMSSEKVRDVVVNLLRCDRNATFQIMPGPNQKLPGTPVPVYPILNGPKRLRSIAAAPSPGGLLASKCPATSCNTNTSVAKITKMTKRSVQRAPKLRKTAHLVAQKGKSQSPQTEIARNQNVAKERGSGKDHNLPNPEYLRRIYKQIDDLDISQSSPYQCRVCDFQTRSRKGAKCHVALHTTYSARMYFCELCDYRTTRKGNLNAHLLSLHMAYKEDLKNIEGQKKKTDKKRCCDFCGEVFDAVFPCPDCLSFMHNPCFQKDSQEMKFNCKHVDIVGGQKMEKEKKHRCDFCGDVLDILDLAVPCPNCLKCMHGHCFQKDSGEMKFDCDHIDIVGVNCAYCGLNADINNAICKLCNRTFHKHCFMTDRNKLTLNCRHTTHFSESKDAQTPLTPSEPTASTSKEIKRELLDLSEFIMLCD